MKSLSLYLLSFLAFSSTWIVSAFVVVPSPSPCLLTTTTTATLGLRSTDLQLFGGVSSLVTSAADEVGSTSFGIFGAILHSSEFWTSIIMLSIIGLLYSWEKTIESARKRVPQTLQPIVDSMLIEMGGLGFIGLFLSVVVENGPLGHTTEALGEKFLGDEEVLLESFEFLHTAFFETAVAFFIVAGLTVWKTIKKIESLEQVSLEIFDIDGDGTVGCEELAEFLDVDTVSIDTDGDGIITDDEVREALRRVPLPSIIDEITASETRIRAETLVVREQFLQNCQLSSGFQIEKYFVPIFGENLEEIVELSPLTWLPLIPLNAIGISVDVQNGAISASSENASLSSGLFLASPVFVVASSVCAALSLSWGLWNFYKIATIKEMLLPTLVKDKSTYWKATLLPPRYEDQLLLESFESKCSIGPFGWIESLFYEEPRNDHERLFGKVGSAGPEFYLNSIKLHTWLVVTQIVFWGLQIVVRDFDAIINSKEVGNSALLIPEFVLYGLFAALAVGQLTLSPQTFLNYCVVTSVEQLVEEDLLEDACLV